MICCKRGSQQWLFLFRKIYKDSYERILKASIVGRGLRVRRLKNLSGAYQLDYKLIYEFDGDGITVKN